MNLRRILYKFPSRERPHKIFNCLDNIINSARTTLYEIMLTLDLDDETMNNDSVKERLKSYGGLVRYFYGTSKNKIHAINKDMEFAGEFDIVCVHSDDMWIVQPGFDESIIENMDKYFPDLDGVLHYPDQVAGERLITYTVMGRKFYDRFGYLYYPGYESVYPDNELTAVSQILGKYKYIPERRIEHRHSSWGFGAPDALLLKTENPMVYQKDGDLFRKRQANNFYLPI